MIGQWKNFDELESELCLDELIAIVDASREKESRDKKFIAAINGIDLDDNGEEEKVTQDITGLRGFQANNEGFGVGAGIGVIEMGE